MSEPDWSMLRGWISELLLDKKVKLSGKYENKLITHFTFFISNSSDGMDWIPRNYMPRIIR